eukprot:1156469-Pelagomonas_calceolata.AAC.3
MARLVEFLCILHRVDMELSCKLGITLLPHYSNSLPHRADRQAKNTCTIGTSMAPLIPLAIITIAGRG